MNTTTDDKDIKEAEFWMSLVQKFSVKKIPSTLSLDALMDAYGE
jgi:hypothetical protein